MEKSAGKTKVLFVITKSNFGGAQHYVYDLARGLPRDKFETVVACGGSGALVDKLADANVRTLLIPSLGRDISLLRDIRSFFALLQVFRKEHLGVVHLNSAKASGLGALAARIAGVPNIIFTAHGWAFNEDRFLLPRMVIKFLSWLTVVLTHKTIAVSEAVRRDTQNWPFIKNKVTTIHNGVDELSFLPRAEARTKLSLPTDTFIIGTIAELHQNKGLAYAITALAITARTNPNLYLVVLGDGEQKNALNTLVEGHKLRGRVLLLGFVEDAARYLKAFDVFVLPSIKEGFPYVILEAGLAGLPVIASRVGGIPEVIDHGKTGLLAEPKDSEALAQAFRFLAGDAAKRSALGEALEKKVFHDLSLKVMVRQTVAVYNDRK